MLKILLLRYLPGVCAGTSNHKIHWKPLTFSVCENLLGIQCLLSGEASHRTKSTVLEEFIFRVGHTHTYMHTHSHMHTHTHTHAHMCNACAHTRTYAHMHMRTHTRTCTDTRTRTHMHTQHLQQLGALCSPKLHLEVHPLKHLTWNCPLTPTPALRRRRGSRGKGSNREPQITGRRRSHRKGGPRGGSDRVINRHWALASLARPWSEVSLSCQGLKKDKT